MTKIDDDYKLSDRFTFLKNSLMFSNGKITSDGNNRNTEMRLS